MREIKFRAFLKKEKCICKVLAVELNRGLDGTLQVEYPDGAKITLNLRSVELMQYTGNKDKNGKEIYEGDIVKTFEEPFFVFYSPEHFCYLLKDVDGYLETMKSYRTQVLGNIYENPELLEGK